MTEDTKSVYSYAKQGIFTPIILDNLNTFDIQSDSLGLGFRRSELGFNVMPDGETFTKMKKSP